MNSRLAAERRAEACSGQTDTGRPSNTLVVDLDGTLIKTDMLWELTRQRIKRNPLNVIPLAIQALRGPKALKGYMANDDFDPALLPYNEDLLDYIKQQRAAGRDVSLATASHVNVARKIATHVGIFSSVYGTNDDVNLKGAQKAARLVEAFGSGQFTYAGDSRSDLPVWEQAGHAIPVRTSRTLANTVNTECAVETSFSGKPVLLLSWIRALRCHQWVKNVLIFAPVFLAPVAINGQILLDLVLLFWGFSLTASAIYLINDCYDLEADRTHERKRRRPFASGALPLPMVLSSPILFLIGIGLAAAVSTTAFAALMVYAGLSIGYSSFLKSRPLVDVFLLASLYTIRLVAGGLVVYGWISTWLIAFSSFCFLSLAFIKRVSELADMRSELTARNGIEDIDWSYVPGRGYPLIDQRGLEMMGICSAFCAALVLTLYVDSEAARMRYAEPTLIFLHVPLFLFWQCRMWRSALAGLMHDDPIVYTAKDYVFWLAGLLGVIIWYFALKIDFPWL